MNDLQKNIDFDFNDKRLVKRCNELINNIQKKHTVVLHKVASKWSGEVAYGRLLKNEKVSEKELLKGCVSTLKDITANNHVLILEDTVQVNYEHVKNKIDKLGKIGTGKEHGLQVHTSLALNATDGGIYGISDIFHWKRQEYTDSPKPTKWELINTPVFEKESGRWITSAERSFSACSNSIMRTVVADREADFYDALLRIPDKERNNHIVIRSSSNRILYDENQKLFEYTDSLHVKGIYTVDLPRTEKRSAHTASLEIRFEKVKIKRPKNFWDKQASDFVEVYVVDVREQAKTVINNEEPIHWRLITTHIVDSLAIARLIIDWYCHRWWIEQLFRTIKKKGLDIEAIQIEAYDRLIKLVILAMIVAVRALQLTKARDDKTNQKLEQVFTKEEIVVLHALNKKSEGKTAKLKNPYLLCSLAYGAWVIARLGGWKGYASQTPAGTITMFEGLKKFSNIVEGWMLINEN